MLRFDFLWTQFGFCVAGVLCRTAVQCQQILLQVAIVSSPANSRHSAAGVTPPVGPSELTTRIALATHRPQAAPLPAAAAAAVALAAAPSMAAAAAAAAAEADRMDELPADGQPFPAVGRGSALTGGAAAPGEEVPAAAGGGSSIRKRRKMCSPTPSPCTQRAVAAAAAAAAAADGVRFAGRASSIKPTNNGEDGLEAVKSRREKKLAHRESRDLEKLKMGIQANTVSVFNVAIRKKPDDGAAQTGFKQGTLLALFKEVQAAFPMCKITGGSDGIVVGATSLDIARRALLISQLGGEPVTTSCAALSVYKARICGVNPVFTEQEIMTELAPAGVTHVKRLMPAAQGERRRPLDKVILTFDRQPPPSIVLASRVYAVTLEVDRPALCFNCIRAGHFADRCTLPKACRRCGKHGHLAAQCTNTPRCVNCKGMHAAGIASCPRVAYLRERNRIILEERALQQLQVVNPTAKIDEGLTAAPTLPSEVARPAEPGKTFAAVVRGIAVEEEGQAVPAAFLPKPVKIVRPKRLPNRKVGQSAKIAKLGKRVTKARTGRTKGTNELAQLLGWLSSLSDILVAFNPQLAEAVRTIERALQPLLALLPLVRRIKGKSTR